MKMDIFWAVATCSLAEIYRHPASELIALIETVSISETSVKFYQTHGAKTQKRAILMSERLLRTDVRVRGSGRDGKGT